MEKLPLCQPLDLGDFQPFSKAAAGCRGRQCLVSAGEAPGAASPLHAQPASLQTQKRKNLPLSSEGDVMTEAKVAKPGRKQETTPQHGRMNLHFGAPLPSQNEPFLGLQFIPVSPSREWGLWLRPFVSPGCSGAKLRVVPKAPPWAVLLQEGFFSLTLVVLAPLSRVPRAASFNPPGASPELSSLARGHPRSGCSFLHPTAGNPQIWGPTSRCCPHVYPKPMKSAAGSRPGTTFDG